MTREIDMKIKTAIYLATVATMSLIAACGGGGGGDGGGGKAPGPGNSPPPAVATTTLSFDHTGFTEIQVQNSFEIIVQSGDHFAIEVTIDEQYSHLVKVHQIGVRLSIGWDPDFTGDIRADVATGIVTLPTIDALDVSGSAVVDIAGFEQSWFEVRQSGSSHVEGANIRADYVDATLSGSSSLDFRNMAPVPAVNINTTGSSAATVNLMAGGALAGSASGSSSIAYYGDSIVTQVSTRDAASVLWLGSSRN